MGEQRILYQYGVNTTEIPRSHVIIELIMLDQIMKLTVGDWLDNAFEEPVAGLHEVLDSFVVIPHYGTFTNG